MTLAKRYGFIISFEKNKKLSVKHFLWVIAFDHVAEKSPQ